LEVAEAAHAEERLSQQEERPTIAYLLQGQLHGVCA
jgi:hypothetical protein